MSERWTEKAGIEEQHIPSPTSDSGSSTSSQHNGEARQSQAGHPRGMNGQHSRSIYDPINYYQASPNAYAQGPYDPNNRYSTNVDGSGFVEESPELLRWRAESLLDEMMLGGVDGSATERGNSPEHSGFADYGDGLAHEERRPGTHFGEGYMQPPAAASFGTTEQADAEPGVSPRNGYSQPTPAYHEQNQLGRQSPAPNRQGEANLQGSYAEHGPPASADLGQQPPVQNQAGGVHPHTQRAPLYQPSSVRSYQMLPQSPAPEPGYHPQTREDNPSARPETYTSPTANYEPQPDIHLNPEQVAEQQRLVDPATYYAQQIAFRREMERKHWAISSGNSNDYLTSVPRYEEAQNRTAAYNNAAYGNPIGSNSTWQTAGHPPNGNYGSPEHLSGGIHASSENSPYAPELGPVMYDQRATGAYGQPYHQQANLPFAERMRLGADAQARSNLLPRQTKLSVDSLYEEMTVLQAQVDGSLPLHGELVDRARHLLEKGRSILEQNPQRSAEVAYYLQQVRGIIQRGQQRIQWSNLYRRRLSRYLTGWVILSLIGFLSAAVYGAQLAETFAAWFPSVAVYFVNHLRTLLIVLSMAALGSSSSALVNMWRYSRREYGFFDRKYGLLGIILPLIAVAVGFLIYGFFAFVYALLGLTSVSGGSFQIVPVLLALLFGIMQEKIYGTSE